MRKYIYKIAIYPLRLYWFIFRPNGYGVKCIIENEKGELLLIRNTYGTGRWNFPGGGLKRGETSEDAIRREVLEEVGIKLDTVRYIGSFVSKLEYKKDHVDIFAAYTTNDMGSIDHDEISRVEWFAKSELPEDMATIATWSLELLAKNK